jgi:S1-C subfamily serine protease
MTPLLAVVLALAQSGEVKSPDFSKDMQASVLHATVRVDNNTKGMHGSGVIIKQDADFVFILTAWHLVGNVDDVDIQTFSAASYPKAAKTYTDATVLARSKTQDLAVVRIKTRDKMPGVLPLCPAEKTPTDKDLPGLTCGCNDGDAPTCKTDTVKGRKKVRRPDQRDDVVNWETATAPVAGRSGGPLVDKQGYVIGIASGANNGLGYFVHPEEIAAFLKFYELEYLGEEKKK